jgi:hypothetical protein
MQKLLLAVLILALFVQCNQSSSIKGYSGTFFYHDSLNQTPQVIPGRLECELYDTGGEGVAFHDTDSTNSGSGRLNPANGTFLNEFRIDEAVDISYTKSRGIDDSPYNFVEPVLGQLYLGWTEPGEWVNYTVDVKQTGKYQIGMMFTCNRGGVVGLTVDNGTEMMKMQIPATFVAADSIAWRQWHHWNYIENLGTIEMKKGLRLLTLHTVETGSMNFNYLDFKFLK